MNKKLASSASRLMPIVLAGLCAAASHAQSYAGDPDRVRALGCEKNTLVSDSRVFELLAFAPGVSTVYGHFALEMNTPLPTQAYFEVRAGVSNGFAGWIVAAGTVNVTAAQVGWMQGSYPLTPDLGPKLLPNVRIVRVQAPINITLNGGFYTTLCPIGPGSGRYYLCSTSGAGGFGPNWNDGKAWFDSPFWGFHYLDSQSLYGTGVDFSLGVQ